MLWFEDNVLQLHLIFDFRFLILNLIKTSDLLTFLILNNKIINVQITVSKTLFIIIFIIKICLNEKKINIFLYTIQ